MTKKSTKKTDKGYAFKTKLTEDDLQKCIDEKMTPAEIAKKYDVKEITVINRFNKMMGRKAAKEAGLENFCVASTRNPANPKVNKYGRLYVSASYCKQAEFKEGEKLVITECKPGEIIIRKITPATK